MLTGLASSSSLGAYLYFCAVELAGMALILWDGLPIYRHVFEFQRIATAYDQIILWLGVFAVQVSYWHRLRYPPPIALPEQAFIAHVLLCLSRLSFIFAGSLFGFVVYRHPDAFEFRPVNVALFAGILFSVFCFSRHLETIGNLLLRKRPVSSAGNALSA